MTAERFGRGRRVAVALLVGTLAFGLAACGRKGPLDPPPGAAAPPVETQSNAVPRVFGDDSSPVREGGITAPQKRIPLDALLE